MEPTDKDRQDFLAIGAFGYCTLYEGDQKDNWHTGTIREAIDLAMSAERSGAPGAFGEGVG